MGDASHPLVREVHYQGSGVGTVYFEPLHIQWLPLRPPYLKVIEVSFAKSRRIPFGVGMKDMALNSTYWFICPPCGHCDREYPLLAKHQEHQHCHVPPRAGVAYHVTVVVKPADGPSP